jgi:hypothetical protein
MILEAIAMSVGAVAMAAIIVHRHLEVTRGLRTAAVIDIREKADPILRGIHHTAGDAFSYVTLHNFVVLCHWLFVRVVRAVMLLTRAIHDSAARIVHKASQKTEDLSRSGAASFYLKQIKEGKDATAPLHR